MDDKKEYYWSGSYVTIWGEVKDRPDMVIVTDGNDYGELTVVARKELTPKEESYRYKQEQKRADELRLITQKAQENFDTLVEKIVDKALISLSSRMKFNVLFGDSSNVSWAVLVSDELKKMVKEKAPEIVKGKEDPF